MEINEKLYFRKMQQLQNSFLIKALWGFMSLYILNCCIDVPGSHFTREDLSINKQESILELIIEKLLGFENAVAEYEDCDSDSNSSIKKNITIDVFLAPTDFVAIQKNYFQSGKVRLTCKNPKMPVPYFEINSPPPEA